MEFESPRSESDGQRLFTSTHWSLVLEAADEQSPNYEDALGRLCESYWHPLYFFALRQGRSRHDAQDLIQGFFVRLMEKGYLKAVDRSKGRFRTFLITAFKRYMANEWRRETALKRGGGLERVPLDFDGADECFAADDLGHVDPEAVFDRAWALAVLRRVTETLCEDYEAQGKGPVFEFLRTTFPGEQQAQSYENAAAALGVKVGTLKSDGNRIRQKFKRRLWQEIRETVDSDEGVEDEIRYLISVLG